MNAGLTPEQTNRTRTDLGLRIWQRSRMGVLSRHAADNSFHPLMRGPDERFSLLSHLQRYAAGQRAAWQGQDLVLVEPFHHVEVATDLPRSSLQPLTAVRSRGKSSARPLEVGQSTRLPTAVVRPLIQRLTTQTGHQAGDQAGDQSDGQTDVPRTQFEPEKAPDLTRIGTPEIRPEIRPGLTIEKPASEDSPTSKRPLTGRIPAVVTPIKATSAAAPAHSTAAETASVGQRRGTVIKPVKQMISRAAIPVSTNKGTPTIQRHQVQAVSQSATPAPHAPASRRQVAVQPDPIQQPLFRQPGDEGDLTPPVESLPGSTVRPVVQRGPPPVQAKPEPDSSISGSKTTRQIDTVNPDTPDGEMVGESAVSHAHGKTHAKPISLARRLADRSGIKHVAAVRPSHEAKAPVNPAVDELGQRTGRRPETGSLPVVRPGTQTTLPAVASVSREVRAGSMAESPAVIRPNRAAVTGNPGGQPSIEAPVQRSVDENGELQRVYSVAAPASKEAVQVVKRPRLLRVSSVTTGNQQVGMGSSPGKAVGAVRPLQRQRGRLPVVRALPVSEPGFAVGMQQAAVVQRQEQAPSTAEPAAENTQMPDTVQEPPPTVEPGGSELGEADVERLAEQVYEIIEQRLIIERESRSM